ncbi:MAG: hypothetical protein OEZ13_00455 [Spirochaetia bacterium]|nr:hypothetical protein [Spirochaetia bacterium]
MPKCEIKKEAAYTVDEFIEVAVSAPASRDANGKVKRKTTAQENALLCAQREVVKFKTGKQSFNVHIQGGEIINKEFDDSQNCTLTYRIKNNLVR